MKTPVLVAGLASAIGIIGSGCATAASVVPLTIVVAAPPGGQADTVARLLDERLTERLQRPVLIVNKPGATGVVAARFVGAAKPDGSTVYLGAVHTLLAGNSSAGLAGSASTGSIATIRGIVRVPYGLAAGTHIPVSTVRQLIDYAIANPGKLNYASTGSGSVSWLASESLRAATGMDVVNVPYHGVASAVQALLAGQVDFMFGDLAALLPYHRSGRLRLLGAAGSTRSAIAPDVPTIAEQGITGFDVTSWIGIAAASATPRDLLLSIGNAFGEALHSREVATRIAELGYEILDTSGPELEAMIRANIARYRPVEGNASGL